MDRPSDLSAPVAPEERILLLDQLRGFALFGILLVNMAYFHTPAYEVVARVIRFSGPLDQTVHYLTILLAETKFVTLFSFLFGVGAAIQMERARRAFLAHYLRRTTALLLMGLVHGLFLWMGDILTAYGLLGFLLLLFRGRTDRTLKRWTVIFLLLPLLITGATLGLVELSRMAPGVGEQVQAELDRQEQSHLAAAEQLRRLYARGGWAEVQQARVAEFQFVYTAMLFSGSFFYLLAIFLIGMLVGRSGLLKPADDRRPLYRRVLFWGLAVGLPANLIYAGAEGMLYLVAMTLGAPALCAAYMAGLGLLSQSPSWAPRLALLAPVGRMALSNYLLQSFVCTSLFYGYGLGLYGQVGPAGSLALAVAIFGLQIPLSRWWLSRFQFGPAEWLWRSITYARPQPLRK